MTANDVLVGLGLVLCLAVASQLVALRLGLPAIIVLLPVGYLAGVSTSYVHPDALLGQLYQPFVTLAVGVILFEAGIGLSLREVGIHVRRVVSRLVAVGVVVTWVGGATTAALLFSGIDRAVAVLLGAIVVVSGPTVVLPLLAYIRPTAGVRSLLRWEGVLVDPIGALLGVLVFNAVASGTAGGRVWHPGTFLASIGVGLVVGMLAAGILMLLLEAVQQSAPRQAVAATLMVVVAAVVVADLLRDDSGFLAATIVGVVLGNQRRVDLALTREFQETLVQLLIGVLFILIAASVSSSDLRDVLGDSLLLVAVLVLVVRPVAVALATYRSSFTWRERALVAWVAPRGIVAGATASAFGLQLMNEGVRGADELLPIVFIVIFVTVLLYGFTSPLVARALCLAGTRATTVLVIGGHSWARAIATALKTAGVDVHMWAGRAEDRAAAEAVGIEAHRGRIMVDAVSREAELEEITDALLLGPGDDFNAVVAATLRTELGHGHVFRIAPDPDQPDLLPPESDSRILGDAGLTFAEFARRIESGGCIALRTATDQTIAAGESPLVVVAPDGRLRVAVDGRAPVVDAGDRVISLVDPATA